MWSRPYRMVFLCAEVNRHRKCERLRAYNDSKSIPSSRGRKYSKLLVHASAYAFKRASIMRPAWIWEVTDSLPISCGRIYMASASCSPPPFCRRHKRESCVPQHVQSCLQSTPTCSTSRTSTSVQPGRYHVTYSAADRLPSYLRLYNLSLRIQLQLCCVLKIPASSKQGNETKIGSIFTRQLSLCPELYSSTDACWFSLMRTRSWLFEGLTSNVVKIQ